MCKNLNVSSILKELEIGTSSCKATNKFGKSIGNSNASYSLKPGVENYVNAVLYVLAMRLVHYVTAKIVN